MIVPKTPKGGMPYEKRQEMIHQANVNAGLEQKKREGRFLSKEDYERATGRPGRSDITRRR